MESWVVCLNEQFSNRLAAIALPNAPLRSSSRNRLIFAIVPRNTLHRIDPFTLSSNAVLADLRERKVQNPQMRRPLKGSRCRQTQPRSQAFYSICVLLLWGCSVV